VADLNAINATLVVIKWKKIRGFYRDLEREHHCTYTTDGNMLINGGLGIIRYARLTHQFVEYLSETMDAGVLYVSMPYATASHKCCCGCGLEVVTPITPTDWKLTFDGDAISLYPSIGNWNFPCRSHYIIERGRIVEADPWTDEEVAAGRANDRRAKARYYGAPEPPVKAAVLTAHSKDRGGKSLWSKIQRLWAGG
jgi:hypothetical protein